VSYSGTVLMETKTRSDPQVLCLEHTAQVDPVAPVDPIILVNTKYVGQLSGVHM
jgi:hypothetical protein